MKIMGLVPITLVTSLFLFACAPKSIAPGNPAPLEIQSKVQPADTSTSTLGQSQPSDAEGWQRIWEKTLAGAKKERKVIVYGPPGSDIRKAMTEEFQKAYPFVEVEWVGSMGAATVPRIKAERRAGLYNVDLHIGGTTSIMTDLMQFALPIEPLLVLPETKDGKFWMGGKLDFADRAGKYNLVMSTFGKVAIAYNPSLVDSKKVQEMSYWDLTRPELKGKVIIRDPRTAGPGQATFTFLYAHPQLGQDMIRALAKNDIVLSREDRQMLEFVSQGKFAIANGYSDAPLNELKKLGIPNMKTQPVLKEGTYSTAGLGSLMMFDNAPHPDSAMVYANWLLSKEGQTAWSISYGNPSRRIDVPTGHLDPEVLIKPGVNYIGTYREEEQEPKDKMMPLLFEVLGR